MATLPLVINGQLVDINQLSGYNYVSGYPELANLLWRHCQNPSHGWTLQGMYIYPIPGRQKIFALPGRSWAPGQRLKAYRFGNTGDYRIIFVRKYDKYTGELWIEVVGSPIFTTPKMGATGYYLMPHFIEPVFSAVAPITSGGTAGATIDEARQGLLLPDTTKYLTLYNDFISPDSYCLACNTNTVICDAYNDGGVTVGTSLGAAYNQHPGLFTLTGLSGANTVAFGRPYLNWTDFSGDDTYFETDVIFNTLASSASYTFQCGLVGPSGNVRVAYTDTLNSGRFVLQHGVNGTITTVTTTLAVTTNTWYKIRLFVASSNIQLQINGGNYAVAAKTNYQGVSQTNLMTPMVRMTGSGYQAILVDYLYFLKHFPGGR